MAIVRNLQDTEMTARIQGRYGPIRSLDFYDDEDIPGRWTGALYVSEDGSDTTCAIADDPDLQYIAENLIGDLTDKAVVYLCDDEPHPLTPALEDIGYNFVHAPEQCNGIDSNADRAFYAEQAAAVFERLCWTDAVTDDSETVISDLITDLLHLARSRGDDPRMIIDKATQAFDEEEAEG